MEIRPLLGVGQIEFGFSKDQVVSLLGYPWQERHLKDTAYSLELRYSSPPIHLYFDRMASLASIMIEKSAATMLFDEPIFSVPLPQFFERHKVHFTTYADDFGCEGFRAEELGLDFVFNENALQCIYVSVARGAS